MEPLWMQLLSWKFFCVLVGETSAEKTYMMVLLTGVSCCEDEWYQANEKEWQKLKMQIQK